MKPPATPLAAPFGTLVRFAALIAVTSFAATTALNHQAAMLLGVDPAKVGAYQQCMRNAYSQAAQAGRSGQDGQVNVLGPLMSGCHDPRRALGPWPDLIALAVFWLAVGVVYWLMPRWRIRRRVLKPIMPDRLPELAGQLRELQSQAGVGQRVSYLLAPLDARVTGLAFGRIGRRHVVLSGGLVTLLRRDRSAFRTVVLHELAHIRNRDLDITFITVAAWRLAETLLAVRTVAVLLAVVGGLTTGAAVGEESATAAQVIMFTVLVPLTRTAVLRSRELHADARAAQWDVTPDGLLGLFHRYAGPGSRGGALRSHPPVEQRRRALAGSWSSVTGFGFWEMAGAGVTVGLIYEFLDELKANLPGVLDELPEAGAAGAALVAVVGLTAWREVIKSNITGAVVKVGRGAAGFGPGLMLGSLLSPTVVFNFTSTGVSPLGILLAWVLLITSTGAFLAWWVIAVTRSWMPPTRHPTPVADLTPSLAAAWIAVTAWLLVTMPLWADALYDKAYLYPHSSTLSSLRNTADLTALSQPAAVMIALLATALVPVAGHLWRHADRRLAQLRTVALATLVGAAGAVAVIQTLAELTERRTMTPIIVVSAIAQAGAAVIVAVRAPHLRAAYALLAAELTGILALSANLTGWRAVSGGAIGTDTPSHTPFPTALEWSWIADGLARGLLLAAPMALVAAVAAELVARHHRTARPASSPY